MSFLDGVRPVWEGAADAGTPAMVSDMQYIMKRGRRTKPSSCGPLRRGPRGFWPPCAYTYACIHILKSERLSMDSMVAFKPRTENGRSGSHHIHTLQMRTIFVFRLQDDRLAVNDALA